MTRPGGFLYLSVMDQDIIAAVKEQPTATPFTEWFYAEVDTGHDLEAAFDEGVAELGAGSGLFAIIDDSVIPNVFHDRAYLRAHWGSVLEWVAVEDKAWFKQAVVILRKPSSGGPPQP